MQEEKEVEQEVQKFTSHLLLPEEDILALGVRQCDVEMYRRKHYQAAFGISSWYNALKEYTFRTESISLHYSEAKAVKKTHFKADLSKKNRKHLKKLEERIEEALKGFPDGAFIKLNTRSPKDVPIYDFENERVKELVGEELSKLDPTKRDSNAETNAFVIATNRFLRISSAKDAIYLLTNSDRVSEDLLKAMNFGKKLFDAELVLREWLDEMIRRPQYEFRAFVHKQQLNAMSQYFCFRKYDDLIARKSQIENIILEFFESMKSKISHESYVIDFYVREDDHVMVIELNPFHSGAGGCLFNWKDDRERFMNGPFEFRITTELETDPIDILLPRWKRFVEEYFEAKATRSRCHLS